MKRWALWATVMSVLFVLLVLLAALPGCTNCGVKFRDPNGVVVAEVNLFYLFQDKDFDKLSFDPNTNEITLTNFGSETSQIAKVLLDRLGWPVK